MTSSSFVGSSTGRSAGLALLLGGEAWVRVRSGRELRWPQGRIVARRESGEPGPLNLRRERVQRSLPRGVGIPVLAFPVEAKAAADGLDVEVPKGGEHFLAVEGAGLLECGS